MGQSFQESLFTALIGEISISKKAPFMWQLLGMMVIPMLPGRLLVLIMLCLSVPFGISLLGSRAIARLFSAI
jgi:hypothetical protein